MNAEQFLTALEPVSYSQRLRDTLEAGRDPQNAALFDELEAGDAYARRLALHSCQGSRDGARAVRLLRDPSRLCRGLAVRVCAELCDAAQLAPLWPELPAANRKALIKRLVKNKRQAVVDALLQSAIPASEWQAWLAFASPAFLATQETALERAALDDWSRLARAQPEWTLQRVLAQVRALTQPDRMVLARASAVLHQATPMAPDTALELVRSLAQHHRLRDIALEPLLSYRPQALAELVLSSGDTPGVSFARVARKLQPDTRLALFERLPLQSSERVQVMKVLSPPDRATLWEQFGYGWRSERGVTDLQLLRFVPSAVRHAEARRNFALPYLGTRPAQFLPYAAFLSWEEARQTLGPYVGDPDPDVRVVALRALVASARFERSRAAQVLALVRSRGNEADPVRGAMLESLAKLPPSMWRVEHLDDLARIQRQALDARDLSHGTAMQLQQLAVALVPAFPEWACGQIGELVKERGHVYFGRLDTHINDAQMRDLGPRLLPVFEAWSVREHYAFMVAMGSLGRRLRIWDAGAQLLVRHTLLNSNAVGAAILRQHRLDLFRELAPQLLAKDNSWGTQAVVYNFVHQERQDLLSPVMLGRERPQGRFWPGSTRFVLPFVNGFWRWTPTQQKKFALTLTEVVRDSERDTPGAIRATQQLAALPDVPPVTLLGLAKLGNTRAALREAALRVLSHLDAGQGVPTLVEALDDERGRIAIYGLRRAIFEMPSARAMEILRATPLQKVTVAKEVLRLLGDLKTPGALDLVLEFDARDLHRDVRVALLRALWEHLEDDRVWPVLERAATSSDSAIARQAARTTAPRLSTRARERLDALLAGLLTHPEARVRMQVLESGSVGNLSDPKGRLRDGLFAALESPLFGEYSLAALTIWNTYTGRRAEVVGGAIERLLPRRRALENVVDSFLGQLRTSSRLLLPTGRAIGTALARDPLALPLRLRVALEVLDVEPFAALVEELAGTGQLHADALAHTAQALERRVWKGAPSVTGIIAPMMDASDGQPANSPDEAGETPQEAPAELLERLLWNSAHPEARRLALATLVGAARDARGWTSARVARLQTMRQDAAPLVASAAQWTFLPDEE